MTSPSSTNATGAPDAWNAFWFAPRSSMVLAAIRVAVGLWLTLYLLFYCGHIADWLPSTGTILDSGTIDRLMDRGWWEFSIFDACATPLSARVVHGVAIAAAVAMTIGVMTRSSSVISWLLFLSYYHRLPPANGLAEPMFAMLLPYLAINPGRWSISLDRWWRIRRGKEVASDVSWSATLAVRLIQLHLTGFLLMTATSRLAGEPWWSGTAIWWLIAKTETRLVDLTGLADFPQFYLVNLWTHLVVLVELGAVGLLWVSRTRPGAMVSLAVVWLSLGILTSDVIAMGLELAALLAFLPAGTSFGFGKRSPREPASQS